MNAGVAGPTELKTLANEFVNIVFWGTMMKEFRANQQPSIFGEGPGSKTFIEELDAEMIKRMSQRGNNPMAESLLKQLGGNQSHRQVIHQAAGFNSSHISIEGSGSHE